MGSHQKHLEKIAAILQPDETVLASVVGVITDPPASTSGTVRGTLAITDRRFLFSGAAWGSKTSRSFPLATVTSIDLHKNLLVAHIQVTLAGGFERFLVKYRDAEGFVLVANDALANSANASAGVDTQPSIADELAKFAALRDQGILTEEEFAVKKAQLLG